MRISQTTSFADVTHLSLLTSSTMSKRGPGETTLKKRKRKRNGISTSSSVLELVKAPPSKPQLMQVWHTNTEDPFTLRQSMVTIPSEPRIEGAHAGAEGENTRAESFDTTAPVLGTHWGQGVTYLVGKWWVCAEFVL